MQTQKHPGVSLEDVQSFVVQVQDKNGTGDFELEVLRNFRRANDSWLCREAKEYLDSQIAELESLCTEQTLVR